MEYKVPLYSKFKKSLPCVLCNASVKNHENLCAKCKKSLIAAPSPKGKVRKQVTDPNSSKIFFLKLSPKNPKSLLKETACFNGYSSVSKSLHKSNKPKYPTNHSLKISNSQMNPKRPHSSFDMNLPNKSSRRTHHKSRPKQNSFHKLYHLSKSPIPELRPSSQFSRYIDISSTPSTFASLSISESYHEHSNTLTDICYSNENLYSVGLDYKLNTWDCFTMKTIKKSVVHSRGVVAVTSHLDHIVTAAKDGKVKYWGKENFSWMAQTGGVKALEAIAGSLITSGDTVNIWKDKRLDREYSENKVLSIASTSNFVFVTGGAKCLKIWDTRENSFSSLISENGPFFKCLAWDDVSCWTGSEVDIKVKNI